MFGTLEAFNTGMIIVLGMVMRIAPIAAFGSIAFTVGKYGIASLLSFGQLMGSMYLTCVLFVFVVLGVAARVSGSSIWKFLRFIREEIFTVLGTSSSESVVPQLVRKLEYLGVSKPVVGLVVPAGVTFNPDGQCIYYTMAAIFIAQATNTPLTLADQFVVLGVLMLTSKGSAGVTGSGMVLLIGVDRFMSEARAITNTIGNGVGALVVGRWVGAVDSVRMRRILNGEDIDSETVARADEVREDAAVQVAKYQNASA